MSKKSVVIRVSSGVNWEENLGDWADSLSAEQLLEQVKGMEWRDFSNSPEPENWREKVIEIRSYGSENKVSGRSRIISAFNILTKGKL